ncbi:MAG: AAA family ATPase [Clostridia bacterium]
MKELVTMDAETLMETPMEKIQFVVDKILPQGLHVLAGSPKIGKSWLSLWMCLQIAKGEPVWGYKSNQCDVLYLCLEDGFSRIQDRLFKITDEATDRLYFTTVCDTIGNGLEDQIKSFLEEHPATKLVVIDTLQKVREDTNGANMYANDYKEINALKNLADENKLAIILVHHLRKCPDDDPINMISGSTGISGSADTNFILVKSKRSETSAKFHCIGRDIEQREFNLEFNKSTFVWETSNLVDIDEVRLDDTIISVIKHIHKVGSFTGTASDLNKIIGEKTPSLLKKKIVKYIDDIRENGIEYQERRTFERREFSLIYDGVTPMTLKMDIVPYQNVVSVASVVSAPTNDWQVINLDPSQVRDVSA